jgi:outer membrane lipoprotein-sorting protein
MNERATHSPGAPHSFAAHGGHLGDMKRSFLSVAVLSAAFVASAPVFAQRQVSDFNAPIELSGQARSAALAEASRALNGVRALQGRFQQVSPGGATVTGAFFMQRPGRLRFEYDAPSPLTIVADGATVAISDRAMRTSDQLPLRATPLYFVLKSTINFEKDARITRVARTENELLITARDKSGQTDGEITLSLDAASKALKRWRIVDGQGQVTQLTLIEARPTAKLDPKLFIIQTTTDPTARRKGG